MFRESQDRVRTMALVHERLYRSPELARVDFAGNHCPQADQLFQTYRAGKERIRLALAVSPAVGLSLDAAVPCGLLVNELVSNCLKHAFRGRQTGTVRIELRPLEDGRLFLCVADDGVGLPEEVELEKASTFGLQLVAMLVKQLKARAEVAREGGTAFRITFPPARANSRGGQGP
jgi:two-component sensor histidine kinase